MTGAAPSRSSYARHTRAPATLPAPDVLGVSAPDSVGSCGPSVRLAGLPLAAPPIQRYRVDNNGPIPIRISDHRTMFVHAGAEPNKVLYARLPALARAQVALASSGSFIHLQAAQVVGSFARIEPRFIGPASAVARRDYDAAADRQGVPLREEGPRMGLASDCNNAARTIMGVLHPPRVDAAPPADQIERPVVSLGGENRQLAVPAQVPGSKGAHERATLAALTTSLREYRYLVAERPIQTTHAEQVLAFLQLTAPLAAMTASQLSWQVIGTMRATQPQVYTDFALWAGLDAAIRPEVGDALVAWQLQNDATAVNARAHTAMVEVLRAHIADPEKRATMIATLGARIVEQHQTHLAVIADIAADDLIINAVPPVEADPLRAHNNRRSAAVVRRGDRAVKRDRLAADLVQLHAFDLQLQASNGANAAVLAQAALAVLGVNAQTPWASAVTILNFNHRSQIAPARIAELVFGDAVETGLNDARRDNDLWNKHWGGVVMTEPSSGDYVTLENDASTEPRFGAINAEWRFSMYGSQKPGQSFHDANEASGDFGPRASTVRFRAPEQVARALPEPSLAERAEARRAEAARAAELERRGIPSGLVRNPFACGALARGEGHGKGDGPDGGAAT